MFYVRTWINETSFFWTGFEKILKFFISDSYFSNVLLDHGEGYQITGQTLIDFNQCNSKLKIIAWG